MFFAPAAAVRGAIFFILAASLTLLSFSSTTKAQRADHLTDEEIELIRDVQEIDYRMEIYARAIERRLLAINGTSGLDKDGLKLLEKETERWGPLPEGTFSSLLSDIPRILDEAISKIEDVAERNESSDLFPFAVYIIADYCRDLPPRLETLRSRASGARDFALINTALGECSDIVEASSKVPRPDPKERNKKKKKT